MPPRYLHIYYPPNSLCPHLEDWISDVISLAQSESAWDGCEFIRTQLSDQLGFVVAAEIARIKQRIGPVVFVQSVQRKLLQNLRTKLPEIDILYLESPINGTQIFGKLVETLERFNGGHPRVSKREMIAFRIVQKLKRRNHWGGTSLNKNFLKLPDIPNGGFPKHVSKGQIKDVVDALFNAGILDRKLGDGNYKYALMDKAMVEEILTGLSFHAHPKMTKYFMKDKETVPRSEIEYREDDD